MNRFQPHIVPVYPPDNHLIFEEWFAENYKGCKTDRELLPFFPTSYWVNNNYAQDLAAKQEAQDYIDSLPDKKYFIICQYDDGCLIDWKGKDVLEFNMSKNIGIQLPLLCQPHPYKFITEKKWLASFVGSRTHPIRNELEKLQGKEGFYISFDYTDIETYCRVLHESVFSICPRGYGVNSFRLAESVQYGALPIYLSDTFIIPDWMDFFSFGYTIHSDNANILGSLIKSIEPQEIISKQKNLSEAYEKFYTYEANMKHIIKYLENEKQS